MIKHNGKEISPQIADYTQSYAAQSAIVGAACDRFFARRGMVSGGFNGYGHRMAGKTKAQRGGPPAIKPK